MVRSPNSPSSPSELERTASSSEGVSASFDVEVFFDGDCPLCVREIGWLRKLDRHGRIRFTNIASPMFSPNELGKTMDELMAEIHGRLPNGEWITGVEVFRQLYTAIGIGPLVKLTRLPGVSHGLDWGYRVFARNRLRWTGRCKDGSCSWNAVEQQAG